MSKNTSKIYSAGRKNSVKSRDNRYVEEENGDPQSRRYGKRFFRFIRFSFRRGRIVLIENAFVRKLISFYVAIDGNIKYNYDELKGMDNCSCVPVNKIFFFILLRGMNGKQVKQTRRDTT